MWVKRRFMLLPIITLVTILVSNIFLERERNRLVEAQGRLGTVIGFIYGQAVASNLVEIGLRRPGALHACDLLRRADQQAANAGRFFDIAYAETMDGMSESRQHCR